MMARARRGSSGGTPSFVTALDERIAALSAWLDAHAPYCRDEQAHTIEGSRERAYWHYGYLIALIDVRELRQRKRRRD
jgi:hypothetical protein